METTSKYFATVLEPARKTARKINLSERERQQAWALHHGPHAKEAPCPLCNYSVMRFKERGGWECCHIVAEAFCRDPHSIYNMLPCCAACNKETATRCVIDLLWERHRVDILKSVCTNVFDALMQVNPQRMLFFDNMMWRVVRDMFGSAAHPVGGGIDTSIEGDIYKMLAYHQLALQNTKVEALAAKCRKEAQFAEKIATNIPP